MRSYSFIKVPNELILDSNLTSSEKIMLIILKGYDYLNRGYVFPSQKMLMEAYGVKSRTVITEIINKLEEKGYIIRKKKEVII